MQREMRKKAQNQADKIATKFPCCTEMHAFLLRAAPSHASPCNVLFSR